MSKAHPTSTIALVTGVNKDLCLETSRQLASAPHHYHILIANRNPGRREAAASSLRKKSLSVEHVTLGVTDDDSINAAANIINDKYSHIDLVNNAGIIVEHQVAAVPARHGRILSIRMSSGLLVLPMRSFLYSRNLLIQRPGSFLFRTTWGD
jgi:NAD(P)-dependent dehydrogenase (short-subunit alcohol dehydrogenase family)